MTYEKIIKNFLYEHLFPYTKKNFLNESFIIIVFKYFAPTIFNNYKIILFLNKMSLDTLAKIVYKPTTLMLNHILMNKKDKKNPVMVFAMTNMSLFGMEMNHAISSIDYSVAYIFGEEMDMKISSVIMIFYLCYYRIKILTSEIKKYKTDIKKKDEKDIVNEEIMKNNPDKYKLKTKNNTETNEIKDEKDSSAIKWFNYLYEQASGYISKNYKEKDITKKKKIEKYTRKNFINDYYTLILFHTIFTVLMGLWFFDNFLFYFFFGGRLFTICFYFVVETLILFYYS
jgi:hypothetical protein